MAVGFSGSAILAMFVLSSLLCISLALFSFRKVSGDMVSGGTNSLVMSAACHVPAVAARSKSPISARQSKTASRSNLTARSTSADATSVSSYQQEPSIEGVDIVPDRFSERYPPPYDSLITPKTGTSSTFGQNQGMEEDELQLLPDVVRGDEDMSLLEEVAMSKIRWGAIPVNPDVLEDLDTDEAVWHLGFGTEEHNVEPPRDGRLYI